MAQVWRIFEKNKQKFLPHELIKIEGEEFHYLAHVLRLQCGEAIEIANGKGEVAQGTLLKLEKNAAYIQIQTSQTCGEQNFCSVVLAVAYLKQPALEETLTLAAELGVDALHFWQSERSHLKAFPENKQARYESLCYEALRINKKPWKMHWDAHRTQEQIMTQYNTGYIHAVCYEGHTSTTQPLSAYIIQHLKELKKLRGIVLWIGPEASFSQKEIEFLQRFAPCVSLGPWILRSPLAAAHAASVCINMLSQAKQALLPMEK